MRGLPSGALVSPTWWNREEWRKVLRCGVCSVLKARISVFHFLILKTTFVVVVNFLASSSLCFPYTFIPLTLSILPESPVSPSCGLPPSFLTYTHTYPPFMYIIGGIFFMISQTWCQEMVTHASFIFKVLVRPCAPPQRAGHSKNMAAPFRMLPHKYPSIINTPPGLLASTGRQTRGNSLISNSHWVKLSKALKVNHLGDWTQLTHAFCTSLILALGCGDWS